MIISDGGGVKSYSSLLIIKALMDHILSELRESRMKKGSFYGTHVHIL